MAKIAIVQGSLQRCSLNALEKAHVYYGSFKTRTIIWGLPWIVLVMCLAVPGLVESIEGRTAIVDFGGVKREAIIDLMEEGTIVPGVYVLVHTGFVIQKLEKEEALETLAIWREVLSAVEEPEEVL